MSFGQPNVVYALPCPHFPQVACNLRYGADCASCDNPDCTGSCCALVRGANSYIDATGNAVACAFSFGLGMKFCCKRALELSDRCVPSLERCAGVGALLGCAFERLTMVCNKLCDSRSTHVPPCRCARVRIAQQTLIHPVSRDARC